MAEILLLKIIGDSSQLISELGKAGDHVKTFSEKVGSIGKVMTAIGGVITGAFALIINQTVNAGDAFNDMNLRTGVSVENLSALAYTAKQTGTDIDAIELSLKFLTKTMDDTSKGTGTSKDTFKELGIEVTTTEGKLRPVVDVMKDIATKVAAIDDPARQTAIAMELFGARSGTQLLPMLKLGASGIDALMEEAQKLNIVFTTDAAQAADKFKDEMEKLKLVSGAVGRDIANVLIPPLLEFTNKAIEIIKRTQEWADSHKPLIEAIILIGAKLAVFAAVGGPTLMAVSALAKLKTAFTALGMVGTGPIGIFIVAVATITVGIIALNEHLKTSTDRLSDFRVEINKMNLAELDAKIQETTDLLDKMQWGLSEGIKPGIEYDELFKAFETEREKLDALYKKREELNTAEKEGIENIKTFIPLTKELADANLTLANRKYELIPTQTNLDIKIEENIRKLYEQAQAYQDLGVSMEVVAEWVELETEALYNLNKAIDDSKLADLGAKLDYTTKKFNEGKPSVEGYKQQIYILEDELDILKVKLAEAGPRSERWEEENIAVNKCERQLHDLDETLIKLKLNFEKAILGSKEWDAAKTAVEEYENKIKDLNDTLYTLKANREAAEPESKEYWEAKTAVEEYENKIKDLIIAMNDLIAGKKKDIQGNKDLKNSYNNLNNTLDETIQKSETIFSQLMAKGSIYEQMQAGGSIFSQISGYQTGIRYVPKTQLAIVHQGEEINPPGQRSYDQRRNYTTSINIEPGAIVIQTPKINDQDGEKIFDMIEKKAKQRGLSFVRG